MTATKVVVDIDLTHSSIVNFGFQLLKRLFHLPLINNPGHSTTCINSLTEMESMYTVRFQ